MLFVIATVAVTGVVGRLGWSAPVALVIVGGVLIATGILGLALVLVLGVLRSFVPVTDVEIIEALDWSDDDELVADEAPIAASPVATEPAVVAEEQPVTAGATQR